MITKKIYYYIRLELKSPLSIGNGDDFLTAHDCIRDNNGNIFIPATSIAGVFSHYLNEEQRNIFTPKKNGEYLQSPYFISDAKLVNNNVKTSIRDGVGLTENKITEEGNKYDFEIVETGTKFDFRIEVTIRDNDNEKEMKHIIDVLMNGLNSGEILLGLKSKRGYGSVTLDNVDDNSNNGVWVKEFTKENLDELLNFNKYNVSNYDSYKVEINDIDSKYDYIEVYLKQVGGLSIRKYSAKAGKADFEHIKSGNTPVIPGTSWAGLIRKQVKYYIKCIENTLGVKVNTHDNLWFGQEKDVKNIAVASNIIIEESRISDAEEITLTRNKINRFSGGASDRALFTEKAVFNGKTKLGIKVKKEIQIGDIKENNKVIIGLIALTLKDLDNGFIALGGQTSIGRGIFKIENIKMDMDIDESINNIIGD